MTKVTLSDVANISGAESAAIGVLNANSDLLTTAIENTLSRNGTTPNSMGADLDMDNNDILNVDNIDVNTLTIDGSPVFPEDLVTTDPDAFLAIIGGSEAGIDGFKFDFDTVALLIADTARTYSNTAAGDYIRTRAEGFAYEVAASGASDHHVTTGGGLKLYVVPGENGYNVKAFGAKGDGAINDYAAIIKARDAAIADSVSLSFTDAEYAFGTTLEFAESGLHVLAVGAKVVLKFTGTGRAVSFDGTTTGLGYAYFQTFGGPNHFYIEGNANCTDLLYTKLVHHSKFKANVREGSCGWRNGGTVLNEYDIVCSANEAAFTTRPYWGAYILNLYASTKCNLLIEGCGGGLNYGVHIEDSFNNNFCGTSEGCITGGVYLNPGSTRNTFTGFDCEVNNGGPDWYIEGTKNTFIGCTGVTTTYSPSTEVLGDQNTFINCILDDTVVQSGAGETLFDGCDLSGSFVNNSTTTTVKRSDGVADIYPSAIAFTPTVTSASGTLTAASATLSYVVSDHICHFTATVTVTTAGTGAGELFFTLPFAAVGNHLFPTREVAATGLMGSCTVYAAASIGRISKYDGTTVIADGRAIIVTGSYEI